ncbi:MAG TPA: hypothetical protein VIH57_18110 [Bacteroidales bacterium]
MKKLVLILTVLMMSLSGFAAGLGENYYMVSTGEKLYFKKIQIGTQVIRATLENGKKVVIPISEVKMYTLNGKIYEKLPVYVNNKITNKHSFMEFVTTRAGLKLYKYSKYVEGVDKATGAYLGVSKVDYYVVYRGDQLHVDVTEKNYQTLFDFFGIKYSKS